MNCLPLKGTEGRKEIVVRLLLVTLVASVICGSTITSSFAEIGENELRKMWNNDELPQY